MLLRALSNLLRFVRPSQNAAPEPSFTLAYRLFQEGHFDDAENMCDQLVGVEAADVCFLRGLISRAQRRYESAVAAFEGAVAGRETEAAFHYSLAELLCELGRYADTERHARRFIDLASGSDPRRSRAWMMLFSCRMHAGDAREAEECAALAVADAASDPAAMVQVADGYYLECRIEKAREVIESRVELSSSYAARVRRAAMLPQIYKSRAEIDAVRERFSSDLDELLSLTPSPTACPQNDIGVLPFYLAYHNENNVKLLRKFCTVARRACGFPRSRPQPNRGHANIRVGFVSTYFYSHSVGRTTLGLIRDLPRPRFHVHVFAIEPADDPVATAIAVSANEYHRLKNEIGLISDAILAADLDVLVFADIGMHPTTYFLALDRLAPLQIATWGHSETSGIDTIDCYLSADGVECETAQEHYSEKLFRPKAFFLPGYARPEAIAPFSLESLGLPTGVRHYACLQPEFKLHPDMDQVLKQILEHDSEGEVVLLTTRSSWTALLKERLQRSLGDASRRVRFLPRMPHEQYLAILATSDVCLDPLYFGGCNSSCEAMALGLPLVTLPGRHLYGRFTAAMYDEMGIHDCIASSTEDYIARATEIASNRDRRHALTTEIRLRSDVLFGRKDITLALAEFLEERVTRHG